MDGFRQARCGGLVKDRSGFPLLLEHSTVADAFKSVFHSRLFFCFPFGETLSERKAVSPHMEGLMYAFSFLINTFRRADWGTFRVVDVDDKRALCLDLEGHFELPLEEVSQMPRITAWEHRNAEKARRELIFHSCMRSKERELQKGLL